MLISFLLAFVPYVGAAFSFALFWRQNPKFWQSLVWFSAISAVQLSWMTSTAYMGPLILVVYAILCLLLGLQFAVLTLFIRQSPFFVAGLWTLFEWARLHFICGFTWNPVGLMLDALPAASLFGIFGLSFWVILTNCFALKDKRVWVVLAILPYLIWPMAKTDGSLKVALVQTGVLPDARISQAAQWERIMAVIDPAKKVDLMVFPEGALRSGKERFELLAKELNTHIIAGLEDGKFNVAFHFAPDGKMERYEKRVLVPIGEYIPFGHWKWLAEFAQKEFGLRGFFEAGKEAKVFDVGLPVGISICLEETFGHLIREARGAKILVNLTNDAWFPHSNLPEEHFRHGKVRAAENGVPLVRACNTGVTGWVDCYGRARQVLQVSEDKTSILYAEVPLASYNTFYSLWGDFAILLISCSCLFLWREENVAVKEPLG